MQILHDEEVRQAQLDQMKRRATLLLVAATVMFFITRSLESHFPWLAIVRATMEAAMVGGLADWFAVTALFRHPLGLPIPHTAIIPARRDRIIDGIVTMVEEDWLSPEAILARLEDIVPSDEVVRLLRDPRNVERIGGPVRDLVRAFGRILTAEEVIGRASCRERV